MSSSVGGSTSIIVPHGLNLRTIVPQTSKLKILPMTNPNVQLSTSLKEDATIKVPQQIPISHPTSNEFPDIANNTLYKNGLFLVTKCNNNQHVQSISPANAKIQQPNISLVHNINTTQSNLTNHNFIISKNKKISVNELLSRIEITNNSTNVNHVQSPTKSFTSIASSNATETNEMSDNMQLYFVDKNSLKRILSPKLKSGIYRRLTPEKPKEDDNSSVNVESGQVEGETLVNVNSECSDSEINKLKTDYHLKQIEGRDNSSSSESEVDPLLHLAHEILKVQERNNLLFDREKNELTYNNPATKKKTVYRIVQPEELDLELLDNTEIFKIKNIPVPKEPITTLVRGRPRKGPQRKITTTTDIKTDKSKNKSRITARTRYGRISKPPKHIQDVFKIPSNDKIPIYDNAKDIDYKYSKPIATNTEVPQIKSTTKRERNIPNDYRCNVCNKIYLGKNRMLRHFEAYPDHFTKSNIQQTLNEMTLYTFLVKKLQQNSLNETERNKIFLDEITDFVDQLQARRQQIINKNSALYFINSRVGNVLGITEGHFGINSNAVTIASPAGDEDVTTPVLNALPPPPHRLDYNLSISLDDTIADAKLNLSETNTTDDMLLQTVDDLVKERLKILMNDDDGIERDSQPSVVHYDHASDNAVEAVTMKETQPPAIIDLSLDLFQFNNN